LSELEKRIVSYRFTSGSRHMLATIVTVPGIDGTFIELQTPARQEGLEPALGACARRSRCSASARTN
jgi:adenylate cyclase, class 2